MLFQRTMVEPILKGLKTETRRIWKRCMVKEHNIYKARTDYSKNGVFALLQITYIKRELLNNINENDLKKEGYNSMHAFKREWVKLYGTWDPNTLIYVIGFKVIKQL